MYQMPRANYNGKTNQIGRWSSDNMLNTRGLLITGRESGFHLVLPKQKRYSNKSRNPKRPKHLEMIEGHKKRTFLMRYLTSPNYTQS